MMVNRCDVGRLVGGAKTVGWFLLAALGILDPLWLFKWTLQMISTWMSVGHLEFLPLVLWFGQDHQLPSGAFR